jgi:hypothetical protein
MSKSWIAETADIMERFDWNRVHKVMTALEWSWWWTKTVPTVEELQATALEMIHAVIRLYEKEGESTFCSTGGFVARIHTFKNAAPQLTLHFEVAETLGIA